MTSQLIILFVSPKSFSVPNPWVRSYLILFRLSISLCSAFRFSAFSHCRNLSELWKTIKRTWKRSDKILGIVWDFWVGADSTFLRTFPSSIYPLLEWLRMVEIRRDFSDGFHYLPSMIFPSISVSNKLVFYPSEADPTSWAFEVLPRTTSYFFPHRWRHSNLELNPLP